MQLFKRDSTHWYLPSGEGMHMIVGANGKLRDTNLRDARKLGLLPSVTNVIGLLAKPALIRWKMEQAVMSALTLPRLEGEGTDAFAARVAMDTEASMKSAADWGTEFHASAALAAISPQGVRESDPCWPWIRHYKEWLAARVERVFWVERSFACVEEGFGGTADALFRERGAGLVLVDLKTQKGKPGTQTAYDEWAFQLAACRLGMGLGDCSCMNLVFSSEEPGPPVEVRWTEEDLDWASRCFRGTAELWRLTKDFDPRKVVLKQTVTVEDGGH